MRSARNTTGSARSRRHHSARGLGITTLVAVLGLLTGLALGGCGSSSSDSGAHSSAATAHTSATPSRPKVAQTATGGESKGTGTPRSTGQRRLIAATRETPDPEEAKSYPAPSSVRHKAAATPRKAAEAVVAPGAPSDAEVRQELARMHAVQRAAQARELKIVPGGGSIGGNGTITAPAGIPAVIARVIAGANAITDFPYVFGGGHASFVDNAYDCSGSVSYALAAGGLLSAPETSGSLESWGAAGPGKWITVYANAGHTYMYVNLGSGWIRYDTSGRSGVLASRWQPAVRSNAGFVARHWPGL